MCCTDGEAFKRRPGHSVALIIMAENHLIPLLKSFIANMLKCKARLKTKFKCVCVTMCFLMIIPFLQDYIKMEIDSIKISAIFSTYKYTVFTQRLVF